MANGKHRPGYQAGLDFDIQPAGVPAGYALGLEFLRGPVPPRPDPSTVRPGGSLPAPTIAFAGVLHASVQSSATTLRPGGSLPFAAPVFTGQQPAFYAEQHSLTQGGQLPAPQLGFAGSLTAPYDSRVQRPIARAAQSVRFEQAARANSALAAVMQDAARASAQVQSVVQQAQAMAAQVHGTAQQARSLPAQVRDVAQQAQPLRQRSTSAFEVAQALHHALQAQAQQAQRLPVAAMVYAWQIADPLRGQHLERFEQGGIQRHMGLRVPPPYVLGPGWRIALEFAPQFAAPRTWGELQTGPLLSGAGLAQRTAQAARVRYQDAMRVTPGIALDPVGPVDPTDPTDPEEPGQTIIITARRAYIVQNSITLTRLDTGAELQAHSFGMTLDYQSWTWSWQASLHHTAAAHLGRDAQGNPADLLATVNGVQFRLRLERVARDRRHLPQERYSVSGKGRAAILDAPWAPQMQFGNPLAEYTAQQLAVNSLTINGVGIGWGVDWQLDDWLVPAGAWALQGSYIAAINDIAQAAGGYVQPHNTDAVLRILHKYPTAPWEWGNVTPDFEIPSALAEVESTEFIDKPIYNRVFVGGQGAGVFGPLTRAATPGDKIAPQATHPLITTAPAWRQRGRAELSDVGKQERIRISLPVLAETGVITPGQFVRYRTGPQHTQTGIVRGTAIDWQRPRLRQTLEIEAHEPV